MAIPTTDTLDRILQDALTHGIGVMRFADQMYHVTRDKFFWLPEPGERDPSPGVIFFPTEPYDDGGGAALAGYRYGRCPFVS